MFHRTIFTPALRLGLLIAAAIVMLCVPSYSKPMPDAFRIALTVSPQPANAIDPATFTVQVTDAKGKPVQGVHVVLNLVMTSMDMGKNEVTLKNKAAGTYVGVGRFTMSSGWNLIVTATKGHVKSVKTFPISVE